MEEKRCQTSQSLRDNSKKAVKMVKDSIILTTDPHTKEISKIMFFTGMGFLSGLMVRSIMVNGDKIK